MLTLQAWGASDVGLKREVNQDAIVVDPAMGLFIVCDGMGGAAAGEVASQLAAAAVSKAVKAEQRRLKTMAAPPSREERVWMLDLLEAAVQQACLEIFENAQANPERKGMGTTVTALVVAGERAFMVHVGDSRAYLLRRGQVHLLTRDHSVLRELVDSGRMTNEQAKESPLQGALSRAVGVQPSVRADRLEFQIFEGDCVLLCTDGLYGYIKSAELGEGLGSTNGASAVQGFIDAANAAGGEDNISAVIIHTTEPANVVEPEAAPTSQPYQLHVDAVAELPLFETLSDRELMGFFSAMEVQQFEARSLLIKEGDQDRDFHVVLTGEVEVRKGDVAIAKVGAGGLLGEIALIDDSPRSATVVALEPTQTLRVERSRFEALLQSDPELTNKLLWRLLHLIAGRLRGTSGELAGAVSKGRVS